VTSKHPVNKPSEDSIKDTLESIVIAFILAFVFRAYVVEAFVIPTGSMAPTLLGRHLRMVCRQCGYQFAVDTPRYRKEMSELQLEDQALCPMCHYPNPLQQGTRVSAGDRILVQKYIYSLMEPRRWDVLVFKAPHEPETNYIKRLVGLPNERLWIVEGNIYVQPAGGSDDIPWRIARKPLDVQRAVWQPIYHSTYEPLDQGRFGSNRDQHPWNQPWIADDSGAWQRQGRNGFSYGGHGSGVLRFDFRSALEGGPGLYSYSQLKGHRLPFTPVEDVRVAATFLPDDVGLSVSIRISTRLDSPEGRPLGLIGRVDAHGNATLWVEDKVTGQSKELVPRIALNPFTSVKASTIELWYVDQTASLWVDGHRVQQWQFDLPMQTIKARKGPRNVPAISIEVAGPSVVVHRLAVDRDLYYTSMNASSGGPVRGALVKSPGRRDGQPMALKDDQFFCCGDNSPLSKDSRLWDELNPWIHARMFDQGTKLEDALGVVPRELIMGRAFFVYFPTPLRLSGNKLPWLPIPNFGDMRFIH